MPLQYKSSYNLLLCHGNYIIELKNWQYLVACLPGASLPTAVLTHGAVSVAGWSATTPYRLTARRQCPHMVLVARLAAAGCQARNQHQMDEPPEAARSPQ